MLAILALINSLIILEISILVILEAKGFEDLMSLDSEILPHEILDASHQGWRAFLSILYQTFRIILDGIYIPAACHL